MLKVVWLSSYRFTSLPIKTTGSWMKPMADALIESKQVELYNITRDVQVVKDVHSVENGIEQWIIGGHSFGEGHRDLYPIWLCDKVEHILDEIKPDIVHIWGTESKWITVFVQGYIKYPCFLDMQGVMSSISPVYTGCLGFFDILRISLYLKNLIHPRESFMYHLFLWNRSSLWEKKMIKKITNVSVQSKWTEEHIRCINPEAKIWHTSIILRDLFYFTEPWEMPNNESPVLFAGASHTSIPYKGLHILIKALSIVKEKYPNVCLKLMGKKSEKGILSDGYTNYLWRLIKELGLNDNIVFLDSLPANEIIKEMKMADMAIQPSFVESYSVFLAEAMMVGMPCISAYSGAIPELGIDGKEQLLYSPTDYYSLAQKILFLFSNKDFARAIGRNARIRRKKENDIDAAVSKQIEIYKDIIGTNIISK